MSHGFWDILRIAAPCGGTGESCSGCREATRDSGYWKRLTLSLCLRTSVKRILTHASFTLTASPQRCVNSLLLFCIFILMLILLCLIFWWVWARVLIITCCWTFIRVLVSDVLFLFAVKSCGLSLANFWYTGTGFGVVASHQNVSGGCYTIIIWVQKPPVLYAIICSRCVCVCVCVCVWTYTHTHLLMQPHIISSIYTANPVPWKFEIKNFNFKVRNFRNLYWMIIEKSF